jgi:sirohydrochlorin cobaltochelatase
MTRHNQLGLLLVGHGTRTEAGAQQLLDLVAAMTACGFHDFVQHAFLELRQPDIAAGISRLADSGATTIVVVPLFLFAAEHVKEDIPHAVSATIASHHEGKLTWVQAPHLGCSPTMVHLSELRFREALSRRPHVPANKTCLLLVGRGSSDDSAIAETHQFTALRADPAEAADTRVAFVAIARPRLSDALNRLAAMPFHRIVVQPHLLFEGEVMDSIRAQVASTAARGRKQDWITTDGLADLPGRPAIGTSWLAAEVFMRYAHARDSCCPAGRR